MSREEAKEILSRELAAYRKRPYNALLYLLKFQDTTEITGASGTRYQLEFQATMDDSGKGDLRVMGAIDDRGVRAYAPLTEDFIITPQGKFVGE